jgi:prevent-host-death family protein
MTKTWAIQDAKNRFSEVIEEALHETLQVITRRGEPVAVILSLKEFQSLKGDKGKLSEFFAKSPLYETSFEIQRNKDLPRKTSL